MKENFLEQNELKMLYKKRSKIHTDRQTNKRTNEQVNNRTKGKTRAQWSLKLNWNS
jgi:hypothetical protein